MNRKYFILLMDQFRRNVLGNVIKSWLKIYVLINNCANFIFMTLSNFYCLFFIYTY